MVSEKILQKLNEHLQKELTSAYFYFSIESYLLNQAFKGIANFFHIQVQEELEHAAGFFYYINNIGGKAELLQINNPKADFSSLEDVFNNSLIQEQYMTKSICSLNELAIQEKDFATTSFLQWFIAEQVDEENKISGLLAQIRFLKDDIPGILMFDRQLSQKVYVPNKAIPNGHA